MAEDAAGAGRELEQIEAALADPGALARALPADQAQAVLATLREKRDRLRAQVCGSGAVAQGEGNVAAGEGGTAIGMVGGDLHVYSPEEVPRSLREAYLRWVVAQTRQLSLSGVDPGVAGREAETRLDLAALYTALLTRSPRAGEHAERPERRPGGLEDRRASALELLDRHDRLVLLGDPGGGKSTFVSFVALCLAGAALRREEVGLELLTAPLPRDDGGDGDQRQPWGHGALLPVRVVLRDFAAHGLAHGGEARDLWDFVRAELEAAELGDWAPALRRELRERGGLVLLDGLDEVPEAGALRRRICKAVAAFSESFDRCRVLVTSRTYAYQHQDWRLPGFVEATLAAFSDGQIRRFVRRWYAHVARLQKLRSEAARGKAEVLEQAIFRSDRLRFLAERPLLLTLMASLHAWRGGSLPERREKLYADTVDLLLDRWERQRLERGADGEPVLLQPSLAEWLEVDREKVRQTLEELAFEAHGAQPRPEGTADLAEGDVVSRLMRLRDRPERNPAVLVDYLSQRAGILEPRGVGVYTFPHRTFQEYLAACHLTGESFPDEVAELARRDPGRWREVALLAGAKAVRGAKAAAWDLAGALCFREPQDPVCEDDLWGALLAAQTLIESADLDAVSDRNRAKVERLRQWLVRALPGRELPAVERALAGDCLARLGDPRFDADAWHLPKEPRWGFVRVPAGRFLMGSDPERDPHAGEDEQPPHELELATFYAGRFPVTVAQFAAFVEDAGYRAHDPEALLGLANHPVYWVSWYDAVAYCEWLSARLAELAERRLAAGAQADGAGVEMLRGLAEHQLTAGLPSEAQWEKAARGADGRIYPWGGATDPELANHAATGLGRTSPVGCFSGGSSPYGCEDISGNVWEWTRSLWGRSGYDLDLTYPYEACDGREDMSEKSARILRGGGFYESRQNVRCAARNGALPGNRWDPHGFRVVLSPFSLSSEASDL